MELNLCMGCMKELPHGASVCENCGYAVGTPPEDANFIWPGTVLLDRFLIGKLLKNDLLGLKYIAYDIKEKKPVFVIRIPIRDSGFNKAPVDVEQLADQFANLSKYNQIPNTLAVLGSFVFEGRAYFVTEHIEAVPLSEYIENIGRKLGYDETRNILRAVFEAVQYSHNNSIYHLSLIPDYIWLGKEGLIKVSGFGYFGLKYGKFSFSSNYVEPFFPAEYFNNEKPNAQYDIYSLAAIAYFMSTGKYPLSARERSFQDTMLPPNRIGGRLPAHANNAIVYGLGLLKSERYNTIEQFAADFYGISSTERQSVQAIFGEETRGAQVHILSKLKGKIAKEPTDAKSNSVANISDSKEAVASNKLEAQRIERENAAKLEAQRIERENAERLEAQRRYYETSRQNEAKNHNEYTREAERNKSVRRITPKAIIVGICLLGVIVIALFIAGVFDSKKPIENVVVPPITGLLIDDVINYSMDFTVIVNERLESDKAPGTILSQMPLPGDSHYVIGQNKSIINMGGSILVTVAVPREGSPGTVANYVYMPIDEVYALAQAEGLELAVTLEENDNIPAGYVIAQDITSGSPSEEFSIINLRVSSGSDRQRSALNLSYGEDFFDSRVVFTVNNIVYSVKKTVYGGVLGSDFPAAPVADGMEFGGWYIYTEPFVIDDITYFNPDTKVYGVYLVCAILSDDIAPTVTPAITSTAIPTLSPSPEQTSAITTPSRTASPSPAKTPVSTPKATPTPLVTPARTVPPAPTPTRNPLTPTPNRTFEPTPSPVAPPENIEVTGVSLNWSDITIEAGKSRVLIASIEPNDATDKRVMWSSSNNDCASVSGSGLEVSIRANRPGQVVVTVITLDGNHMATCSVTVVANSKKQAQDTFSMCLPH